MDEAVGGASELAGAVVLAVHPGAELYGADRVFHEAVEAFRSAGASVPVVLPGSGPLAELLDESGFQVTERPFPVLRKSGLKPLALLRMILETPVAIARLVRMIKQAKASVVYVSTITAPHWLIASRLARVPVMCHVHEAEETAAPLIARALTSPLRAASSVVANSRASARWISANCKSARKKTNVVYNGVEIHRAPRTDPVASNGPLKLVLVGRVSPRKGQAVAVDMLKRLDDLGVDAELELVGSVFRGYEWFERELREHVFNAGLVDRVTFTSFLEDPGPAFERADIVLVPSLIEPFGNVAVEAMLFEVPVVASRVGGLPEIVIDGETGLLCQPGDVEGFAAAVKSLASDREMAQRMGAAGHERAQVAFCLGQFRARMVKAMKEIAI